MSLQVSKNACSYCELEFSGTGYSPDGRSVYCCYGCYLVEKIVGSRKDEGIASWILIRLGIGAFFAMNVMMLSLLLYIEPAAELGVSTVRIFHYALIILSTPAIIILGLPFITGAVKSLKRGHLGMDGFVVTTSLVAYAVSTIHVVQGKGHIYFDTATMLLLIITIGRLIEASAKNRTSKAIRDLLDLTPAMARVVRDGIETEIPSEAVLKGDIVISRPGEKIPVDGLIISGECMLEESAFTGESRPRSAGPGDTVYGGSLNCDGFIKVEAAAVGEESMVAQIQLMINHARQMKSPIERAAEKATCFFVPVVWLLAAGSAVYWLLFKHDMEHALLSSLAVMIVACPCALGIATPIAASLAIGKAAGSGVLIRSGEVLERLNHIRRIYFDKTGTITEGRLTLSRIITVSEKTSREEVLTWAASLETGSEHAIARAIMEAALKEQVCIRYPNNLIIRPGCGVEGHVHIDGKDHFAAIGSERLLQEYHSCDSVLPEDAEDPYTAAYLFIDNELHAVFLFEDTLRPDASTVIDQLKSYSMDIVIISGDRKGAVDKVADAVGVDAAISECTPSEKASIICKAGIGYPDGIAMVGDGINDAAAMAEASVGIAVYGGTDLARHVSQVVMLGDDLMRIPWTFDLAKYTYRIIKQNLAWAFGYNGVAILLAFFGYVHPLIAASAMVVSSAAVLSNSLRVAKIPLPDGTSQEQRDPSQRISP